MNTITNYDWIPLLISPTLLNFICAVITNNSGSLVNKFKTFNFLKTIIKWREIINFDQKYITITGEYFLIYKRDNCQMYHYVERLLILYSGISN